MSQLGAARLALLSSRCGSDLQPRARSGDATDRLAAAQQGQGRGGVAPGGRRGDGSPERPRPRRQPASSTSRRATRGVADQLDLHRRVIEAQAARGARRRTAGVVRQASSAAAASALAGWDSPALPRRLIASMKLILASSSPRRSALLDGGRLRRSRSASPTSTRRRCPTRRPRPWSDGSRTSKARAVPCAADELVLAADTTVACDGDDHEQARRRRRGGCACCGACPDGPMRCSRASRCGMPVGKRRFVERTVVWFATLSEAGHRLVRGLRRAARQGRGLRHPGPGVALRHARRGLLPERGRPARRPRSPRGLAGRWRNIWRNSVQPAS